MVNEKSDKPSMFFSGIYGGEENLSSKGKECANKAYCFYWKIKDTGFSKFVNSSDNTELWITGWGKF